MRKLSSFGRDTGLQIRMATTMFLLGLVYVVFVGALFAAEGGELSHQVVLRRVLTLGKSTGPSGPRRAPLATFRPLPARASGAVAVRCRNPCMLHGTLHESSER